MNTNQAIGEAAQALAQARSSRKAIHRVSETFGILSLDAAYEVASLNISRRVAEGRRVAGLKVGLTSKAVQQQLGVSEPDFGVLLDDMEVLSGETVSMERLLQPKVEAEVAFVVGKDIHGFVPTYSEFLSSLAFAIPAIEIVDSAIADWKITLVDTVADNASSGLYVLGDQPLGLGALTLSAVSMEMRKNGTTVSIGSGAACMGHPLRAAYWLARTMTDRGQGLKSGQVILSGALGPMVPVVAGDYISVSIAGLGDVSCHMN